MVNIRERRVELCPTPNIRGENLQDSSRCVETRRYLKNNIPFSWNDGMDMGLSDAHKVT